MHCTVASQRSPLQESLIRLTQRWEKFGGVWIVIGSVIFFGTIIAPYFMRPLQRPVQRIIDTIEYNLKQLDELSVDELDLLKETTDALIMHMEASKQRREDHKT